MVPCGRPWGSWEGPLPLSPTASFLVVLRSPGTVLGAVGLGTETTSALVGLRRSFIWTPGQQLAHCWLSPACLWGPCRVCLL